MTDRTLKDLSPATLSRLPSITIENRDLDIVELYQCGLAGSRLQLTTRAQELLADDPAFVIRDVEATPLLLATREQPDDLVSGQTIRDIDFARTWGATTDLAVIVEALPNEYDLARVDALTHRGLHVEWIVLAPRSREGRELMAGIADLVARQLRGHHHVSRLPWPTSDGDCLMAPTLPSADHIASRFGSKHHVIVSHRASGTDRSIDRGGTVVFFTGLSGSGKSTVARGLRDAIEARSDRPVTLLDGDDVRRMLTAGLGFDEAGRAMNVRRVSWVAALLAGSGSVAITALIAPFNETRAEARRIAADSNADFVEVWLSTSLEECERRDRKGLYALARAGEIPNFTGIGSRYDEPQDADLVLDTSELSVTDCVELVFAELEARAVRRGIDPLRRPDPTQELSPAYEI